MRYIFKNWQDGVKNVEKVIVMTENLTLTAYYAEGFTLAVTSIPINVAFTINLLPLQTPYNQALVQGTYTVTMPIAVGNYRFKNWEDGTTNPTRTINLDAITSMIATYEVYVPPPVKHSLVVGLGAEGTTSPESGTYQYVEGSTVPVTAIPDSGYKFVKWLLDGTSRTENPITVTMDKDHTLIPVFEYVPPLLTATITGYVKDAATDNPMPGATVTGDGYADVTEIDGLYELKDVPAATYTLTIQKEGYEPQTLSVDASSGGTFTQDVSMEPEAPPPTTPFDTWWAGVEEFFKRLGWPVPPKPPQPPGT